MKMCARARACTLARSFAQPGRCCCCCCFARLRGVERGRHGPGPNAVSFTSTCIFIALTLIIFALGKTPCVRIVLVVAHVGRYDSSEFSFGIYIIRSAVVTAGDYTDTLRHVLSFSSPSPISLSLSLTSKMSTINQILFGHKR